MICVQVMGFGGAEVAVLVHMLLEEKGAGINAEETLYCITGWLVLGCKLLLDTLSLWVSSSPVCQACIVFSFSCGKSRREKLLLGVQAQS